MALNNEHDGRSAVKGRAQIVHDIEALLRITNKYGAIVTTQDGKVIKAYSDYESTWWSYERIGKLAAYTQEGLTTKQIAERLKTSTTSIWRKRIELGIPNPVREQKPKRVPAYTMEDQKLDNERGLKALAEAYARGADFHEARAAARVAGASFKAIAKAEGVWDSAVRYSMSSAVKPCGRCKINFVGGKKNICDQCRNTPPKPRQPRQLSPKTKEQYAADAAEWYRTRRANNPEWREKNRQRAKAWREKQKRGG